MEFDPETGYYYGDEINPPPALCLTVHRRNERWRRLLGQPPASAIEEGDTLTIVDTGIEYVVNDAKPSGLYSTTLTVSPPQ